MIEINLIIFGIFAVMAAVQLFFYLGIFSRLAFYKNKNQKIPTEPITVIVCAKSEEDNLRKCLPTVLEQDYPNYEVIVVNDNSWDETGMVLEELEKKYEHLRTITIKQDGINISGKKYPLTLGIKGAKNEILLMTDADCEPKSKQWISTMVRNYSAGKEIVLGYGAYQKLPTFLNKIIRFDTFFIALQYFSLALIGRAYMGVGRNLSYRNSLFFKLKGFATHLHITSGDDDLFISRAATKNNVAIEVDERSHTISTPKENFSNWIRQKGRHITTAKFYKPATKMDLALLTFSSYCFIISFISLLIMNFQIEIIVSIFVFRLMVQYFIFYKTMQKLGEKDLLMIAPVLELVLLFFYPIIFIAKAISKENQWK